MTVTVADWFALPPAPVQVTVYVVDDVGETETEPEVALAVEKFVPAQLVALVELQVIVDDCPLFIDVGEAEMVAVGTAAAVTVNV